MKLYEFAEPRKTEFDKDKKVPIEYDGPRGTFKVLESRVVVIKPKKDKYGKYQDKTFVRKKSPIPTHEPNGQLARAEYCLLGQAYASKNSVKEYSEQAE